MSGRTVETVEPILGYDEERVLLRLARSSLEAWIREAVCIDLGEVPLSPALQSGHCAFVSLHRGSELRGCVGFTTSRGPLALAVRDSAIQAARDPRFAPVHAAEVDDLTVEISVLTIGDPPETPFVRVRRLEEIRVGRDGLFVRRPGHRGGLLLPQVAVAHGWRRREFLGAVCRKAGYSERAWREPETEIHRFGAQVFSEGS